MNIFISGSMAYDRIMDFPGYFKDYILAVSGADALEKLRTQDVDLILTDMNMPELDGAGLINAVHNELKRDTPIIVITTKGEQVDREKCIVLGANGYITKPLNPRELRETMLKFLWKAE